MTYSSSYTKHVSALTLYLVHMKACLVWNDRNCTTLL